MLCLGRALILRFEGEGKGLFRFGVGRELGLCCVLFCIGFWVWYSSVFGNLGGKKSILFAYLSAKQDA